MSFYAPVEHALFSRDHGKTTYLSLLPCLEIEGGLCCLLKEPCFIQGASSAPLQNLPPPVIIKKPALDWKELDR